MNLLLGLGANGDSGGRSVVGSGVGNALAIGTVGPGNAGRWPAAGRSSPYLRH